MTDLIALLHPYDRLLISSLLVPNKRNTLTYPTRPHWTLPLYCMVPLYAGITEYRINVINGKEE